MIDDRDIIVVDQPDLSGVERLYVPQIVDGMRTTIRHMAKAFFGRPITVQYPEERRELRMETYRGLHRLNRDEEGRVACVACFMCATACPANCIHIEGTESPWPDREKYPSKFEIDELRCIYCGMCEEACPVNAIELTHYYHFVSRSRKEMILDKEELLAIYDETAGVTPRENPRITGYMNTGNRWKQVAGNAARPARTGDSTAAPGGTKR